MDLEKLLVEVDEKTSTQTNASFDVEVLKIDISGYSPLAQTCWLTFKMDGLGKAMGKEWVDDEYVTEVAEWNARYKIEEIINKIKS